MDTLEKQTLHTYTKISLYKRYTDDIFVLVRDKDDAQNLHEHLNGQHPSIKFEIEHPDENNSLNILDFSVSLSQEGITSYQFYKKDAKKDIFINYRSALPMHMKRSIIKNEKCRITQRCTTEANVQQNMKKFALY